MRLHTLHLQAFGPFAGSHTVDFDALTRDGLFLLHGDTGAARAPSSPQSASPSTEIPPPTANSNCAATTPPPACSPR